MNQEVGPNGEEMREVEESDKSVEKEEFRPESLAFVMQDSDGRCKRKHILETESDGTVTVRQCQILFRDRALSGHPGWDDAPFSYRHLKTPSEVIEELKSKLDGSWHLVDSDGEESAVTKKTKRIGFGGIDRKLDRKLNE